MYETFMVLPFQKTPQFTDNLHEITQILPLLLLPVTITHNT